ncbi:MAG: hypothetical protein M0P01_11110, partial [Treponema sp.]|nr:hypothetical protein [Treponema sp.]
TSSIGLALETAPYYGLTAKEARQEADTICQTVHGNWRRLAGQYGISYSAAEYMSPAFVNVRKPEVIERSGFAERFISTG